MPSSEEENIILIKRSNIPGVVPRLTSLELGELGLNTYDGKIFLKTETSSSTSIKSFLNSEEIPYVLNKSLSSTLPLYGNNTVSEVFSIVLGGYNNDITGGGSAVVNGEDNDIHSDFGFIGSGLNNTLSGDYGAILGGKNNQLNHSESFIVGSNITSHASNFTYVNNISATEKIYGDGSELTGIVAGDTEATTLVRAESANWGSGGVAQTLSFNEITKDLSLSYGNTVSLSAFGSGADTELRAVSANWDIVYSRVVATSANWDSVYTSSSQTSANWDSTYTTVNTTSANWDNDLVISYADNTFLPISGGTLMGNLSVLGDLVYVDTSVAVVSAMYIDTNTILDPALRITQRGTGDVIRVEDSANPDSTPFIINSDGLVGVGTSFPNEELTVIGNVSATGFYYGDGSNLTGIVAGDIEATTFVRSNSANWQSTYTTVSSMSASWQTTFQASSAYVSSNPTGITGASALTKMIQITQAGYNSITPASDTLYIIVG